MRLGSFTNLRLAEIGTGVPHEMKLFWPPSPMAVYISPIASITPQICSEQATRQSTTTTISERPKMRTIPRNPNSPAQRRARGIFGSSSRGWGPNLTELQREHWITTAQQVPSHPSLAQYSHLSGQQLCVKINSPLRCVGQAPVDEPPDLVVFTPNPTGDLVAVTDESGGGRLVPTLGPAREG